MASPTEMISSSLVVYQIFLHVIHRMTGCCNGAVRYMSTDLLKTRWNGNREKNSLAVIGSSPFSRLRFGLTVSTAVYLSVLSKLSLQHARDCASHD